MTLDECKEKLKFLLVASLHLEGIEPSSITDDMPLFSKDGLNLDSLDAVELVVVIEKEFGLEIKTADEAKELFVSVNVLANAILNGSIRHIQKNRKL